MENRPHFLEVQHSVLENEQKKEKIPEEKMFSFVISNSALFRYFSNHLPKGFKKVWDAAASPTENKQALEKLTERYQEYRADIISTLESLDQEMMSAFSDAVDEGDVDKAVEILKPYFEMRDQAEAEMKKEEDEEDEEEELAA
jgi:hypothetical protein